MNIFNGFKTTVAAAAFALAGAFAAGTAANATPVASVNTAGEFAFLEFGGIDALGIQGSFSAALDPTFDPSEVNDFLFQVDLAIDGSPVIDEELLVPGITGNDIIAFAFFILDEIDLAFPDAIDNVIDEILDTDNTQTEIVSGLFLSLDFDLDPGSFVGPFVSGDFLAFLSEEEIVDLSASPSAVNFGGEFIASASITAVPLPATLPLLAFAAAGLLAVGRRRKS